MEEAAQHLPMGHTEFELLGGGGGMSERWVAPTPKVYQLVS
jgi:hypothetical protein